MFDNVWEVAGRKWDEAKGKVGTVGTVDSVHREWPWIGRVIGG